MKAIILILATILFLSACGWDNSIKGYVAENTVPEFNWLQTKDGDYYQITMLNVVLNNGTIKSLPVRLDIKSPGNKYIIFKSSYPPAVGKKVYIKALYQEDGEYNIQARLNDPY